MAKNLISQITGKFNIWPLAAFGLWLFAQTVYLLLLWAQFGSDSFPQSSGIFGVLNLFVPGSLLLLAAINTTSKPLKFLLPTIVLLWQNLIAPFANADIPGTFGFLIRLAPVLSIISAFFVKSVKIADEEELCAVSPEFRSARSLGRVGLGLLISSPFFALSPAILALILTPLLCGDGANESNCGPAVLPWFLIATIPAGFVMAIVGSVIMVIGSRKKALVSRANLPTPLPDKTTSPPEDLHTPPAQN